MDIILSITAIAALGVVALISAMPRSERRAIRVPVEKRRKL